MHRATPTTCCNISNTQHLPLPTHPSSPALLHAHTHCTTCAISFSTSEIATEIFYSTRHCSCCCYCFCCKQRHGINKFVCTQTGKPAKVGQQWKSLDEKRATEKRRPMWCHAINWCICFQLIRILFIICCRNAFTHWKRCPINRRDKQLTISIVPPHSSSAHARSLLLLFVISAERTQNENRKGNPSSIEKHTTQHTVHTPTHTQTEPNRN